MASFIQKFSLKAKNIGKRSKKKYLEDALYKNLFKEGGEENHVRKNLNQFLKSQKSAFKWEVGKSLKVLRQRKLYAPALKVSRFLRFLNIVFEICRTLNFCIFRLFDLEKSLNFCSILEIACLNSKMILLFKYISMICGEGIIMW